MSAVPTPLHARAARPQRTTRPQARPRLRVVPDPARHPLLWAGAALLVLALGVFGAVTASALAAEGAVAAAQLEDAVTDAQATHAELLVEVAELEDPARIARVAQEQGLVRADRPRLLPVQRVLPADGAGDDRRVEAGDTADRLKPLLAQGG